jgi:hypothetical protein
VMEPIGDFLVNSVMVLRTRCSIMLCMVMNMVLFDYTGPKITQHDHSIGQYIIFIGQIGYKFD